MPDISNYQMVLQIKGEAFLKKHIKDRSCQNAAGCWIWQKSKTPNGYGKLSLCNKFLYAHRLSWTAFLGAIPKDLQVCHHCDTPSCVNPNHLFLGTQKDNMDDMFSKNRNKAPNNKGASNPMFGKKHTMAARKLQSLAKQGKYKGSHHPRASITEETAILIKNLKGQKTRIEVSKMLDVSSHVVANIWAGKSWRFING